MKTNETGLAPVFYREKIRGQLIFEVRRKDGHSYKIFEDGRIEGFPDDVCIWNSAHLLFTGLLSLKENIKGARITGDLN